MMEYNIPSAAFGCKPFRETAAVNIVADAKRIAIVRIAAIQPVLYPVGNQLYGLRRIKSFPGKRNGDDPRILHLPLILLLEVRHDTAYFQIFSILFQTGTGCCQLIIKTVNTTAYGSPGIRDKYKKCHLGFPPSPLICYQISPGFTRIFFALLTNSVIFSFNLTIGIMAD